MSNDKILKKRNEIKVKTVLERKYYNGKITETGIIAGGLAWDSKGNIAKITVKRLGAHSPAPNPTVNHSLILACPYAGALMIEEIMETVIYNLISKKIEILLFRSQQPQNSASVANAFAKYLFENQILYFSS